MKASEAQLTTELTTGQWVDHGSEPVTH